MRLAPTALRGLRWEQHAPRLRLHIYEGVDDELTVYDAIHGSVEEAWNAARTLSDENARLWSLAVVHESAEPGLIWISGYDYRRRPTSIDEWRLRGQMQDRYLSARADRGEPLLLPSGLRVIRMFPEWTGGLSLWESFGDSYPFGAGELPIPQELEQDLTAWNLEWEDFGPDARTPEAWFERGWDLYARLQEALEGIAEVRPEFAREEGDDDHE